MINSERLINRFINLIKIDSPSREEEELCRFLRKEFDALGCQSYVDQAGANYNSPGGNLVISIKGNNKEAPTLLFSAHMDTVVSNKGVEIKITKDLIKTNGSTILGSDDKAGVAILLEAITIIKEKKFTHGDIELVFTIGEELGLLGSRYLDYSLVKAKFGYVLDSGGDVGVIINNAPGEQDFKIKFLGKAAHSGVNPEKGINAIQMAGDFVSWFPYGRIDEETTANIGIISGGEAVNIIPAQVILEGEFRSKNEHKLGNWVAKIDPKLLEIKERFGGDYKLDLEKVYSPYLIDKEEQVVRLVIKALDKQGLRGELKERGGGSDANNFNAKGIRTVNLGIGITNGHTNKEEILTKNLIKGTQLIIDLIQEVQIIKNL